LFVSRSVPWREVGIDREGHIPMDTYKILVPVHAGAYANWQAFVRSLLSHTTPYTQRTYASEPGLAWLSMINEGNLGNFYKDLITFPEWKQAWNQWLAKHYPDRAALATAWGAELKADEAPAQGTVGWPENFRGSGLRARDCVAFFSDTEHAMIVKMKAFLRDELGCHALVSNANSWTYFDFVMLTMLFFARFGASRMGLHGPLAQTMSHLHLPDDFPLIDIAPRQEVRQQHFDIGAA